MNQLTVFSAAAMATRVRLLGVVLARSANSVGDGARGRGW